MTVINFVRNVSLSGAFALTALAAAATIVVPVSPTHAAGNAPTQRSVAKPVPGAPLDLAAVAGMRPDLLTQATELASRPNIGVLTREQVIEFGRSHPEFVAKLHQALASGSMSGFTAEELRFIEAATGQNLQTFKAGDDPAGASTAHTGNSHDSNKHALWAFLAILMLIFGPFLWCRIVIGGGATFCQDFAR
jgi:hypothetical protein